MEATLDRLREGSLSEAQAVGAPFEAATELGEPEPLPVGIPSDAARKVIGGTGALGLGMLIERGAGFTANILAARLGGASTFGAYSLGISTANQISTYAAGQIGSTAARFSGKYPQGSAGYSTLARALMIVSLASAAIAAAGLWLGASPIARLLGKQELTSLLRWAVLSAAGMIVLECARGFFVGQRKLVALVLLSSVVGLGMITLLPWAAHSHSPIRMMVSQGAITCTAVIVCLLLARPLGMFAPESAVPARPLGPVLREVWSFGFIQLAGLVASNLSGWWLTALVARSDKTLVQMSFFAIASQLRNMAGIVPSLLTEGSYAVMADAEGQQTSTPHRVMAVCSYASLTVAVLFASLGIVLAPWALTLLYGHAFDAAALTTVIGLAIAVVHMGNAPAAARLTIVSIRATGVINTVWAVFVAAAGSVFLFHGGSAARAMAVYFAGHVLSAGLVLLTLQRKDHVPDGMVPVFLVGTLASVSLASLAFWRAANPAHALPITTGMSAVVVVACGTLYGLGRRFAWLPSAENLRRVRRSLLAKLTRRSHV